MRLNKTRLFVDFISFFFFVGLTTLGFALIDRVFVGTLIYSFGLAFVLAILVGFLIVWYISKATRLDKITLLGIILIAVINPFLILVKFADCEGLGCIGAWIAFWLEGVFLIFAAGSVPMLYARLSNKDEYLLASKKFWLSGITISAASLFSWFLVTRVGVS